MKPSFVLVVLFVVGSGAAGAAAFSQGSYRGSDLLYNVTNQAIENAQLGNNWNLPTRWLPCAPPFPPPPPADYVGGGLWGSDGAETLMLEESLMPVDGYQQTGPMSRFLSARICRADVTQASGIVLAIDAPRVFAAGAVIGANAACDGDAGVEPCTPDPSGLAYDSTGGNTMRFTNWRDVLALLYGGLDRTTGITDCNGAKRQTLVSQWHNLFENKACTQPLPNQPTSDTPLTHAWRLDDRSEQSNVFAQLIGLEAPWRDPVGNAFPAFPSKADGVNAFGTSPYCNAMNWDPSETSAGFCGNTAPNHYIGPGGVVGADGKHHLPPPGAYGSVAPAAQPFVFPTSYQDNDPIRTKCLNSGAQGRPGEDVCNTDHKLGVVLPVPALDFIALENPGLVPYPSLVPCAAGMANGAPPKVMSCAPRGKGVYFANALCPNGDTPFAFGCFIPIGNGASGPTSQCIATNAQFPTLCNSGNCAAEGRVYNLQAYDGTGGSSVSYLTVSVPVLPGISGPFTTVLDMTGAYGRIHMREVSTPGAKPCQLAGTDPFDDATDQIGCLVQADTHSIGAASYSADTWEERDPLGAGTPGSTVGLRINKLQPGVACTPAAPGSGLASYPLWQKMYLNSIRGFGRVVHFDELSLAEFESFDQNMTPIVTTFGFLSLPFSPNGTDVSGGPNQFCEDFNEAVLCGAPTNANACATNTVTGAPGGGPLQNTTIPSFTSGCGLGITTPGCPAPSAGVPGCTIPSDPSSNPAMSTTSTVCGNGIVEAYEDCDPPSASCTNWCRSTTL